MIQQPLTISAMGFHPKIRSFCVNSCSFSLKKHKIINIIFLYLCLENSIKYFAPMYTTE